MGATQRSRDDRDELTHHDWLRQLEQEGSQHGARGAHVGVGSSLAARAAAVVALIERALPRVVGALEGVAQAQSERGVAVGEGERGGLKAGKGTSKG